LNLCWKQTGSDVPHSRKPSIMLSNKHFVTQFDNNLVEFRLYSQFAILTIITSIHNERMYSSLNKEEFKSGKGKQY